MSPISITHADDGTPLANYRWEPNPASGAQAHGGGAASGGIYLLHGMSEYAGRYHALAEWLNARGWRVAAHDHRGHGRSGGARAGLRRAEDLVHDAQARLAAFANDLGQAPVLLGHSMGGLVAARLALDASVPLRGLILLSPALKLHLGPTTRQLLGGLARLAPGLPLPHRSLKPRLTHDQVAADTYARDALVNRRITPRLVQFIATEGPKVLARAHTLQTRTLLLVAGDDRVVDASGSRAFASAAPPGKVAMRWYEQAWHELLHESAEIARPVYGDLDTWLAGV